MRRQDEDVLDATMRTRVLTLLRSQRGKMPFDALCHALGCDDQLAPPTANLFHQDPLCDLDFVPRVARDMKIRAALSNSFGFGGTNATLAFRLL